MSITLLVQRFHCDHNFDLKQKNINVLQQIFKEVWFADPVCPNQDQMRRLSNKLMPKNPHGNRDYETEYLLPNVSEGVLTMHFDSYITDKFIQLIHSNVQKPVLGTMTCTMTFDKLQQGRWWGWRKQANGLRTLKNNTVLNASTILCNGHTDIYYIPGRLIASFNKYASLFREQNILNEIAIPTILKLITDTYVVQQCGNCCKRMSVDSSTPCSHPVDLKNTSELHKIHSLYKSIYEAQLKFNRSQT